MMLYKFPLPTRANGVRLYALPNQQLGIEVARPRNATMAYDAELATGRTVTIGRPDIDKIIADAVRQVDAMPKAGIHRSMDMKSDNNLEYDDDASKVLSTLMDYLEDKLTPDQMAAVNQILATGDGETDADRIGEKSDPVGDRRGRRPTAYGADDRALRRRPMSAVTEREYSALFPNAGRLA